MQLIQFDTAGIQPYIFRSNRLRENFGASYLVAQATDAWVREAIRSIVSEDGQELERSSNARFEIICTAGGNALVLSRCPRPHAPSFGVLCEAPSRSDLHIKSGSVYHRPMAGASFF